MNLDAIPFVSFEKRLELRRKEYSQAISDVLDSGNFILGDQVSAFEQSFSEYLRGGDCVGVGNGTDGLEISISALGLQYGSRIATVANAGGYSTVAILKNRMQPMYMDVDIDSRNVLLCEVQRVIDEGAKAIILTHLYGKVIDCIDEIVSLCQSKNVLMIEDASQAHGAKLNGVYAGRFGDISAFSLYPSKNLGALGDAGIIVVNNPKFLTQVRKLRTYGWSTKYDIDIPDGRNSRLDEIQAAILQVNLRYLDSENRLRVRLAQNYSNLISNENLSVSQLDIESHVYHLFTLTSDRREDLMQHLRANGIASSIHFPLPDYAQRGIQTSVLRLANTEYLCRSILSIPCHPDLSEYSQLKICEALNDFS